MRFSVLVSLLTICVTVESAFAQTTSYRPPAPFASFKNATNSRYPFVLGHRGSPALRPEHTIPSYTLGIQQVRSSCPPVYARRDLHVPDKASGTGSLHCRPKQYSSVGIYQKRIYSAGHLISASPHWYINRGRTQGADFIECDAVLTKDCQFICRHEPLLSNTTNAGAAVGI